MRRFIVALGLGLTLLSPVWASGYCLFPNPTSPDKCDLWYLKVTQPSTTRDQNRWRCPTYQTFEIYYTTTEPRWYFEVWSWTTREEGGYKEYAIREVNPCDRKVNRAFDRWQCYYNACLGKRTFKSCDDTFPYPTRCGG